MCSVTWHHTRLGYELFFNRDELRTRAKALPPSLSAAGSVRYLAPTDTEAGGTWVAVNEHAITVGLLNSHPAVSWEPDDVVSRGLLVRKFADLERTSELEMRLRAVAVERLQPFTLFAVSATTRPVVLDWDGVAVTERVPAEPALLSSSSTDPVGAADARRRVLADLLDSGDDAAAAHHAFHRSHSPERGARSPCMHRPDARTVSLTHVTVRGAHARVEYVDGPPCRAGALFTSELDGISDSRFDGNPVLSGARDRSIFE
jgi:hypothetical protein